MSQLQFDDAAAKSVEIMYLTPDVTAQRARVLDLMAPKPGERILDIGIGPGLLAYDLAQLVGSEGRVVGIDPSPAMITMASTRLAALPQCACVRADAAKLEFPDGHFDGAVATQVYEYVEDMPRALSELHRVLRPGGRTLILDTDWRSIVWHSSDAPRMERVLTCWDDHLADPHLPARLGPLLNRAGFSVVRVEIVPMLSPGWQPASYAAGIMRAIRNFVRINGSRHGLAETEIQAWYDDQLRLAERQEFFFSLNRYAFLAVR